VEEVRGRSGRHERHAHVRVGAHDHPRPQGADPVDDPGQPVEARVALQSVELGHDRPVHSLLVEPVQHQVSPAVPEGQGTGSPVEGQGLAGVARDDNGRHVGVNVGEKGKEEDEEGMKDVSVGQRGSIYSGGCDDGEGSRTPPTLP
jgi:hypothetical protein